MTRTPDPKRAIRSKRAPDVNQARTPKPSPTPKRAPDSKRATESKRAVLAKRLAQVKRVAEARRAAGAKSSRKPAVGRTGLRGRVGAALATPFGLATLCCLILAGWALWAGGILDGAAASAVRTSSVYAASGVDLDVATAQKIVGNRRLVVIFARPGTDLRGGCHAVRRAAAGTLVLLLSRDGDSYDHYGCAQFGGDDTKTFGKRFVAESRIPAGIDEFVDRPLDALKVIVVNFDTLANAGIVPAGARTISPSLPRYLVAAAALAAVLLGSGLLYLTARRAGRLAAVRRARLDSATDSRTVLSAATAVVAQQIIDLDSRYALLRRSEPAPAGAPAQDDLPAPAADAERPATGAGSATGRHEVTASKRKRRGSPTGTAQTFASRYRELLALYTGLLADVAAADRRAETDFASYTERAEALSHRLRDLAG